MRQAAHGVHGLLGFHGQGGVYQALVALEDARYEAVGDALYEVLPDLPAQQRLRLGRLHGEELYLRVYLAEGLADADERASCADAHDQGVRNDAFWELREDLRPQPDTVLLHVPLRLELRRAEVAWLLPELFGLLERLVHVEMSHLQDLGSEGAAYGDPLARHPLRHDDEHPVALDGGDHGQSVSGVARGGLDYGVAF